MLYKTIVQSLLEANPHLHEELRQNRMLRTTLDRLAEELREDHLALKEQLRKAKPRNGETEIASEALEMAIADLSSALAPTDDQHDETATRPTPPA
jgi:hypothetical protein